MTFVNPTQSQQATQSGAALIAAMPAVFVLLWSTGFIGMRLGAPFAEPFTFMSWRMLFVVLLLGATALAMRAPWPRAPRDILQIAFAGLLVHATYLCGVLYAIKFGLPLGYVALIAGLQPVLTAAFTHFWWAERLAPLQWCGMTLGLLGVMMVVGAKSGLATVTGLAIACALVALLGITAGTLFQKRYCANMDIRTGGVIQFGATGIVLTALAFAMETRVVQWTGQFVFALAWLVLALSIGAITLLYLMIRRGAAARVASLFFLTPAVTAVMAFAFFDEALPTMAIVGLLVTGVGVALVTRGAKKLGAA